MRLLFYNHGGFSGFVSCYKIIDTELKRIVIVDNLASDLQHKIISMIREYLNRNKIPEIKDFPQEIVHEFNGNIDLLECFLSDVEVIYDFNRACMDDIYQELFLTTKKVKFKHITLDSCHYVENSALAAKINALFSDYPN